LINSKGNSIGEEVGEDVGDEDVLAVSGEIENCL
jgi:hypothetical protein